MTGQHIAGAAPVRWLDEDDVAALTRTPVNTIRSWRRRRIGPVFCRVGRRVIYDARDVDAFIASGRIETTGVVHAPGPERPLARRTRKGSGVLARAPQTASQGFPGVPVPTDTSPGLSEGREEG